MNAILNRHDEAQWALIAQCLKTCTPKLQLSFIDYFGSFSQIFEARESIDSPLASYGEQYKHLTTVPHIEKPAIDLSDEESQLLDKLSFEPILLEELETPWTMDKLLQLLIALELKGAIVSEQGYFSRV